MGLVKTESQNTQRIVPSESLYKKIFQVVEITRARMKPGTEYKEIKCPVCGGYTAFVDRRELNTGGKCTAACSRGCFACSE